ncbi:hypothetical protein Q4E93_22930 [Flavitalea sp. BT771]|uniref:hypothetical protein n=1 Tax=Flavitalea sp. BT771 TaxID=3063329 RepID=UPI0026E483C2|nr:hypothetical protein [Flavitalea sp. BT771]MDO6433486.1 hypothetical protein [Flavitalea sp. BT771]MDV6222609.1 hypothetical protein [Flavitalea sp. BT771]
MKKLFFGFFGLLIFSACNDSGTSRSLYTDIGTSSPSLKIDPQNWGGDFTINIWKTQHISHEKILYTLLSWYGDKPVGFYLILRKPEGKSIFVNHGATFKPMGDTSNHFLAVLAKIYGIRRSNLGFADSVVATYANLSDMADTQTPGNWAAAQTKLFFGDGSVELYMNIDQRAGTISFPEKDSANRAGLIDAFSRDIKR